MNGLLLGIILLTPLAPLLSGLYRLTRWSLPVAALPPLVASLLLPSGETAVVDWLLLGARMGTDAVTQWLLPAAALVWAAAALQHAARPTTHAGSARFRLFFLLALCGNLLLLLAQDAITFYAGFALMGLSGYGLVIDRRSTHARVAAGTYLRWTIAGELLLFAGLLSLAHDTGSTLIPVRDTATLSAWTLVLLISGFGIKIGLPGLHAWMPGTYSAASTAASAAFGGAMSNAGVLGLLHFLPLQQNGYTTTGIVLLAFGLFGAFYGVLLGLPQRTPRVILAYSSVSQLGTLAAMIGLALMAPDLAPALIIAVTLYAVHHGLTKAALFLALDGVAGPRWRGLSIATLIVLSLMMAGLPYSSGALAKGLIKSAIGDGYAWLVTLLAIATIATALLMTRFLFACLAPARRPNPVSDRVGVGLALALALLVIAHTALYQAGTLPSMGLDGIWPLVIAAVLVFAFLSLPSTTYSALLPVIPRGDLPAVLAKALLRLVSRTPRLPGSLLTDRRANLSPLSMTQPRAVGNTPGTRTGADCNS